MSMDENLGIDPLCAESEIDTSPKCICSKVTPRTLYWVAAQVIGEKLKAIKFPPPIYPHSLNDYVKYNADVAEENAQKSMNSDAAGLCSDDNVGEISVSADGTWQKKYEHNALLGASFVLTVNNGQC